MFTLNFVISSVTEFKGCNEGMFIQFLIIYFKCYFLFSRPICQFNLAPERWTWKMDNNHTVPPQYNIIFFLFMF